MRRVFNRRTIGATTAVCLVFLSAAAFAADPNPPSIHSERGAWPICRQWNVAETRHFAEWLRHIYNAKSGGNQEQRLAKLERVLTDPSINRLLDAEFAGEGCNEQLGLDTIRAVHRVVDCAKLSVILSSYYSYRRGLPWVISRVRACDGGDLRTADYTFPVGAMNSLDYDSPGRFFRDAVTGTCTGNFRVELGRDRSEYSDTLPVAIARGSLIPGCLYYLDGHVLILADVSPYGETRFLDATTAASRDIYAFNGFNAVSGITPKRSGEPGHEYAGCFRGFRVYRWPIAEVDETGKVTRVRRRTDEEMKEFGFSTEQYDRIEELVTTQQIVDGPVTVDSFHEFVRLRLRTVDRADPAADLHAFAGEMLALLKEREQRVQAGWRDVNENGPVTFPEERTHGNVFTAGGRWGEHSTAMADAAFRTRYFNLAGDVDVAISWFDRNADEVVLDDLNKHAIWGRADLAEAVLRAKNRIFADAAFEYTNSAGQPVRLSLLDVEKRLYDLSFDPNHPPEVRWGAAPGSPEAQSAAAGTGTPLPKGDAMPMEEAYRREAYYRALTHWEPEQSYLREMFTEGFPVREKIDDSLRRKWFDGPSPPLVPHNGKAAWLKEQGAPKVALDGTPPSRAVTDGGGLGDHVPPADRGDGKADKPVDGTAKAQVADSE